MALVKGYQNHNFYKNVLYAVSGDGEVFRSNVHERDNYFNHSNRTWTKIPKLPKGLEFIGNYAFPAWENLGTGKNPSRRKASYAQRTARKVGKRHADTVDETLARMSAETKRFRAMRRNPGGVDAAMRDLGKRGSARLRAGRSKGFCLFARKANDGPRYRWTGMGFSVEAQPAVFPTITAAREAGKIVYSAFSKQLDREEWKLWAAEKDSKAMP
jgi:hypothetical protein